MPDTKEVWVGTEIGGIHELSFPKIWCQIWQPDRGNKNSLSANPVSSVCEDNKGNLWIGTIEGGLNLKRKDKDGFEHFKCDKKSNNSLINNSISGLLIDSRNYLWAYTWGMGISKININDLNNLSFKNYSRGMTQGLTGNFISSACEDTINNGIWFGTTEGLHFYDNEKETFQPVRFNISGNNFDSMNSLCIDRKHRLWIGTSRGVFIINLFSFARSRRHFDYKHITEKLSDSKSSTTDKINCIYEDGNGIIWIGCNGSGLYKLESDKNDTYCFSNYTLNDGLPNNNIIGILEDNSGNLWFSTNQGISQLTKSNMVFNNYSKHDEIGRAHV